MKLSIASAALLALVTAGCLFPRYESTLFLSPDPDAPEVKALSAAQAEAIFNDAIAHPPAGHHPNNPGWLKLGRWATGVRLSVHSRTGLVLVEVMEGKIVRMEFYVHDMTTGREFANAIWRAKRELRTPTPAVKPAPAPAPAPKPAPTPAPAPAAAPDAPPAAA